MTIKTQHTNIPQDGNFFSNLKIGVKLSWGFGSLVALTILVVILSVVGSSQAASNLSRTKDLRVPTTNASTFAKADMLEMLANIRGYLALGEPQFREGFSTARQDFEVKLAQLETLSVNWTNPKNKRHLDELKLIFNRWVVLPEQMFNLHDDPQANQPAQRILTQEGQPRIASIIADITTIIEVQAQREPSVKNQSAFKAMADFRGSFAGMGAGIRGYLATLNPTFKVEYKNTLATNEDAWRRLNSNLESLTPDQLILMENIAQNREAFLPFPEQMFTAVEGERAHEDLYLLSTLAAPQAAEIVQILDEMSADQTMLLQNEVDEGNTRLINTQIQTLGVGVVAILLGLGLTFFFRRNIANPIVGLSGVTTQITTGNLAIRASITSRDEIGELANNFNDMAKQLQKTLAGLEQHTQRLEILSTLNERLTAILSLDGLLKEMVQQVDESFDYYQTSLYLVDNDRQNMILAVGSGEAGTQMKAQGYSISFDVSANLVVRAVHTGKIVQVDNVHQSSDWLPNPLLPDTSAELAAPIVIKGQVMGVLNVQKNVIGGFDESDIYLLRTLAGQAAVAINNAQLFEQVQTALEGAEIARNRYVTQAWRSDLRAAYARESQYIRPGTLELDNEYLTKAAQKAVTFETPTLVEPDNNTSDQKTILAPVILNEQTIGTLHLHHTGSEQVSWDERDLALVQTILDQVAQTAENLRIFDETRQRAGQEQTIREITDKLRAAPTLEHLIEIATTELIEYLPGNQAQLNLGGIASPKNKQNGSH